jgi:hypothetical protein
MGAVAIKERLVALAPLALALGIAAHGCLRLPVIDDEATTVDLARAPVSHILRADLRDGGHFHAPLNDLVLSAWLSWTGIDPLWFARVPACAFWLALCALVPWALAPVASASQRTAARRAVVLLPAHWTLPFVAIWYSLAALLGLLSTGFLLRVLSAPAGSSAARRDLSGWVLSLVALGWAVHAWPAVLLGQVLLALCAFGPGSVRERLAGLVRAWVVVVLCLAPTFGVVADRMTYAVRGRAGGGGFNPAGAVLALVLGETVPAWPALWIPGAVAALAGVLLALGRARRLARAVVGVGCVVFVVLAATRTLSDKRLLLATPWLAAGLGMALAEAGSTRARWLLCLSCVPALIGLAGIQGVRAERLPLAFPRWQDPHREIAEAHCRTAAPRWLVADHPALLLTARVRCGSIDTRGGLDARHTFAAIGVAGRERLEGVLRAIEARDRSRAATLDLVSFLERPGGWTDAVQASMRGRGFRVVSRREFGADALASLRGPRRPAGPRYRWLRLRAEPAAPLAPRTP